MKIDTSRDTAADSYRNKGVLNKQHKETLANLLEEAVEVLKAPMYCHVVMFPNADDNRDLLNYLRITLQRKGIEMGWAHAKEYEPEEGKDLHHHLYLIWDDSSRKAVFQSITDTLQYMKRTGLIRGYYVNPMRCGDTRSITPEELQSIWYHFGYLLKARSKIKGQRCVSFRRVVRPVKTKASGNLSRATASFTYTLKVIGAV